MRNYRFKYFGKLPASVFAFSSIVWFLALTGCASYGIGGVYTSSNQTEMGAYIFGNSQFAETTINYAASLSEENTQLLGLGLSLKIPISIWRISIFPLIGIEYQRIFGGAENGGNLIWARLGGGLDFSITDALYLRGEVLYAPDFSSFMPKIDIIEINRANSFAVRFALGWKPGAAKPSKQKSTSDKTDQTKTDKTQPNQSQPAQSQTNKTQPDKTQPAQTQTNQPQTTQPKTESQTVIMKDGWNIANLDTARNVQYLSTLEKDIILEMNMARSDPKKYAEMYINPNLGAYAKECYNELRNTESLPVFNPKRGLSQAARDHVADTGPKGITGHDGADGSSMSGRINRYGTWGGGASENISYGYNTAREIVLQLLIDDGVSSRGHRRNIMNKNSKYVGVSVGTHSVYRYMCVQDFAVEYTDK